MNLVLDFLSDAAGFVINKQVEVSGSVEIWSARPVTRDEAVELLGSVLGKNGYGVTRNGRILTILSLENMKTADTEIVVNSNPAAVEKSSEVQTQIIPVRYATASQLAANVQQLLPATATLTTQESANTLILVASKTDIKRVLRIVDALDSSLATGSSIKVHALRYANAKDATDVLSKLFAPQSSDQALALDLPNFPGGSPGGEAPAPSQRTGDGSAGRHNAVVSKFVAAADERSNSVILSAPPELVVTAVKVLESLDHAVSDAKELRVFRLTNAAPDELADQLAKLYPQAKTGSAGTGDKPIMFPFGPDGAGGGVNENAGADPLKRAGTVLALSDARTASLIVSASKSVMPQIARMIQTLDADSGKREIVSYFELRHADPQDISQNLQDLFNRNGPSLANNQNTFLGRNHPLTQRQTQAQQSAGSTSTSFGSGNSSGNTGSRSGP